jgi:hypothetical protein
MSASATPGDAREARQRISPADSSGASAPTSRRAFLLIRIWMPSQPAVARGLLSWGAETSLIQMIADLVSASGGAPAGKRKDGLIARFGNAADASAAAIRLQRAIAGFAAQSKAPSAAALALFCEDKEGRELDESSDELETASVLASAAQPAQILLTAAACAQLNLTAPYTSRSAAPFRMPYGMHSNLKAYQLTWNSASPISGERPRTENTTPSRLMDPEARAAEPARIESSAAFPGAVPQPGPFKPADPAPRPRTDAFTGDGGRRGPDVIPSEEPEAAPNDSRRRLPLYAGIAAVTATIIAAGTWLFTQRSHPPRITNPPKDTQVMKDPPKSITPATGEVPKAAAKTEPSPADTGRPTPGGPEMLPSQPPKRTPLGKIPPEKTAPGKAVANADGFFRSDIPWLLARADRESGDGEYDAAERHYRIVQKLDPGNSAARNGISRNSARRSEQQ